MQLGLLLLALDQLHHIVNSRLVVYRRAGLLHLIWLSGIWDLVTTL